MGDRQENNVKINPLPWVMRFSSFPAVADSEALKKRIFQTENTSDESFNTDKSVIIPENMMPENTALPASPKEFAHATSSLRNCEKNLFGEKNSSGSINNNNLLSFTKTQSSTIQNANIHNQSKHTRTYKTKNVKMSSSASSVDPSVFAHTTRIY